MYVPILRRQTIRLYLYFHHLTSTEKANTAKTAADYGENPGSRNRGAAKAGRVKLKSYFGIWSRGYS